MLILMRDKDWSTRKKTLEAHRRDQQQKLSSNEIPHQTWFQWLEAQRANRFRLIIQEH